MSDVLMLAEFNERFTIYLNTAGKPVQRTLREMTAGEVLLAMEWAEGEADKLERDVAVMETEAKAIRARAESSGFLPPDEIELLSSAVAMRRQLTAALHKSVRLDELVYAALPLSDLDPTMRFHDALRRFWPGGRR